MHGPFDVIFCRNVMIYFDQATRERLVSRLAQMLAPGGYLCIGHAESIHSVGAPVQLVGRTIYRNTVEAQPMKADGSKGKSLPRALPGFESVRRYLNASGVPTARILPGEYYVTREDEDHRHGARLVRRRVHPQSAARHRRHESFHAAAAERHRHATRWESVAGRATRYGSASMEQLINRVLSAGGDAPGSRSEDIRRRPRACRSSATSARTIFDFVREFLRQEGLKIAAEDSGDTCSRHVQYFPRSGRARVRHLSRACARARHARAELPRPPREGRRSQARSISSRGAA